jgi:hypothetical protein
MSWITLNEGLLLSDSWQYLPVHEGQIYRFSFVSGTPSPSGIGRYEVGQFDEDGSGFALRAYRTETFGSIIQCVKPNFFESQHIGLRLAVGFNPFVVKAEVNDMPLTTSFEGFVKSDTIVATTIAAVTAAAILVPANPNRKALSIHNTGTGNLFIDIDGGVTTTSYMTRIPTQGYFETPVAFLGAIHGVWSSVNGTAEIREYV